jgi:hypothetical protein
LKQGTAGGGVFVVAYRRRTWYRLPHSVIDVAAIAQLFADHY